MRLWFCACFLFCAYSVSILMGERDEVTYILENKPKNYDLHLNYSLCLSLRELLGSVLFRDRKAAELTVEDLKTKLGNSSELSKLAPPKRLPADPSNNHSDLGSKDSQTTQGSSNDAIQMADLFRSVFVRNDFYIHMNLICFILDEEESNQTRNFSKQATPHKQPTEFVVRRRPFSFFKTKRNYQLLLLNNDNDHSHCERRGRKNWNPPNERYSRFECTNRCLKAKRKSAHYFYPADDEHLLELIFSEDPLHADEQRHCFEACAKDECEVDVFLPRYEIRKKVLFAELMLSHFDYRITFAGLISLFLNLSIQETVRGLIGALLVRFRNQIKHLNLLRPALRISTLLICGTVLSAFYYLLIDDFLSKTYDPTQKETTDALLEIRPAMHLIICTPIAEHPNLAEGNFNDEPAKSRERKSFEMTFSELENATNADLWTNLKSIHFSFLDEQQEVDLVHFGQVYFRFEQPSFMRCFKMQANFKREARFRFKSLLLISKLSIEFQEQNETTQNAKLYLIGNANESFTSQTIQFDGMSKLSKYQIRLSKHSGRCANHKSNCTNRWNCIDVCVNRWFISNHSALSIHSVIGKQQFTERQWSSLKPNTNRTAYEQAKKECEAVHKKPDCFDHSFRKTVRIGDRSEKDPIQVDLHYELVNVEDEQQSVYKLVLTILTIQSIFFGLNALKLLLIAICFLRTKFNLKDNKIYTSLAYCICLACFLGQSVLIFVFIVDESLTKNQYFERPNSIEMPEMVFCFRFDRRLIDEHQRLTGHYLEQATENLTASSIFESFAFLNSSNEWVRLNMSSFQGPTANRLYSAGLEIRTVFFQHRKCFYINLDESEYRIEQFYYRENGQVFELRFTEEFKQNQAKTETVKFFVKQRDSYHFSKMVTLDRNRPNVVKQELFEILHQDRFGTIKLLFSDPLSLFRATVNLNEVDEYTVTLLGSFKQRLQMATTSWPLKEHGLFHLAVENELFEQYCRQVQAKLDEQSPQNANYRRAFFINHFEVIKEHQLEKVADFKFEILFFKKYLILTNSENWPKLVISLLNVASIWLNVGVFDLHEYFGKPTALLGRLYSLLLRLKEALFTHIEACKRSAFVLQ